MKSKLFQLFVFTLLLTELVILLKAALEPKDGEYARIVQATITSMEHIPPKVVNMEVYNSEEKCFEVRAVPRKDQYRVTAEYKGLSETVDDESLFNQVEIGDHISANYVEYWEDGKVKWRRLILPFMKAWWADNILTAQKGQTIKRSGLFAII